jgi:TPR repeat protein
MVSSTGAVKLCITINLSELSMQTTTKLLKALFIICWLLSTIGCDIRDPEAQFLEGKKYYSGNGVPKNYKEAMKLYRLAAEQGYAPAQWVCRLEMD